MCGITGFYSTGDIIAASLLGEMTTALAHRGPDAQGFFGVEASGNCRSWNEPDEIETVLKLGLGFRRLSILDLSDLGSQPMHTPDRRFWICFNGEIYNYVELKQELLSDLDFRSTSDTEVLLSLFSRFGIDCVKKLNGIFAFAAYDTHTKKLWVVRDPLGIKPLYYVKDHRGFFFASEIRSLLKARISKPSLRLPLLSRYLMTNWIPDPETLFEGIHKLEPGHFLVIGPDHQVHNHCYWDMNFRPDEEIGEADWLESLDHCLKKTVERQLRSDVPVGFFLSGGIDSSLLAAKAVEVQKDRPTTFTIGFKWSQSKEDMLDISCARLLKSRFPLNYNEIILEPSIVSILPKIIDSLEEPIADPAAICSYLICEAASERFKVLISGQGGDELFGGYPVYQGGMLAHGIGQLPSFLLSLLNMTSQMLPYSIQGHRIQNVHRLKKLFFSARRPWPEPFMMLRGAMRSDQLTEVLTPDTRAAQFPPFARHLEHYTRAREWDVLQQMMYLDIKTYLPCLNLTYTDKTSMNHSVEVRVPFLDMEMVQLAERVPSRLKTNLNDSKILLKDYADRILPREVVHRKKSGFGLPLRDWFLKDLQPLAQELLSPSRILKQNLFEPALLTRWLKEHREMTADHSLKIYSLMTFQLWYEQFGVSI